MKPKPGGMINESSLISPSFKILESKVVPTHYKTWEI